MPPRKNSPSGPARFGLKLFYLRTRVRKISQTAMARELQVRQATISNIEQGVVVPGLPFVLKLCRYFDVTADYFLNDEIPIQPGPAQRLANVKGLVAPGQYLEVEEAALHRLPQGTWLVAVLPGTPAYDEDAARRRTIDAGEDLIEAWRRELARSAREEKALSAELERERQLSRLRRRGISRSRADELLGPPPDGA